MPIGGRWVGGPSPTSARVVFADCHIGVRPWGEIIHNTMCRLMWSKSKDFTLPTYTQEIQARQGQELRFTATGLTPSTRYYYQLIVGGVPRNDPNAKGSFTTLPPIGQAASFNFMFGSGFVSASTTQYSAMKAIASKDPLMFIMTGDLFRIGLPPPYPGQRGLHIQTLLNHDRAWWYQYDQVNKRPYVGDVFAHRFTPYVYNDQDWCGDGSWSLSTGNTSASTVYRFRVPTPTLQSLRGVYQTWKVGRVQFIMLDTRAYRTSHKFNDDTGKLMLGYEQKKWFQELLIANPSGVKIIISASSWYGLASTDGWASYQNERNTLLDFFTQEEITNMYFICGDQQQLAADDGTNTPGGIPTVTAGPLCMSVGKLTTETWSQGKWAAGTAGVIGAFTQAYGAIEVIDNGTTGITIKYTGWDAKANVARITMTTAFTVAAPAEARLEHDTLQDAYLIDRPDGTVVLSNVDFTTAGQPGETGRPWRSAWYKFTPLGTGTVIIDNVGTNDAYDLRVYSGSDESPTMGALAFIDSNDGGLGGGESQITFDPDPGVTYYIQQGDHTGTGIGRNLYLNWTGIKTEPDPPIPEPTTPDPVALPPPPVYQSAGDGTVHPHLYLPITEEDGSVVRAANIYLVIPGTNDLPVQQTFYTTSEMKIPFVQGSVWAPAILDLYTLEPIRLTVVAVPLGHPPIRRENLDLYPYAPRIVCSPEPLKIDSTNFPADTMLTAVDANLAKWGTSEGEVEPF